MNSSNSIEEYLKTIYVLEQETGQVRVTDIATKEDVQNQVSTVP